MTKRSTYVGKLSDGKRVYVRALHEGPPTLAFAVYADVPYGTAPNGEFSRRFELCARITDTWHHNALVVRRGRLSLARGSLSAEEAAKAKADWYRRTIGSQRVEVVKLQPVKQRKEP